MVATDVTAAAQTPPPGRFLGSLEGVRGLAAIGVLATHVSVHTGDSGYGAINGTTRTTWIGQFLQPFQVAVPFFCAMAGFLLYQQFVGMALTGAKMQPVGPYLWRRALRVLPLYWLAMAVAMVGIDVNRNMVHNPWDLVRPFLLLQIYQKNALPDGMVPTWTLATEAVFYLLLPVLAVLLARLAAGGGTDLSARVRRVLLGLGVLVLINIGWTVYSHLPSMGQWPVQYFWLPGLIGYFAAGMGVAVLANQIKIDPTGVARPVRWVREHPRWLWVTAAVCFAVLWTPLVGHQINTLGYPSVPHAVLIFFLDFVCSICIVAGIAFAHRKVPVASTRVAVFVGGISYGMYLWHELVAFVYFRVTGTHDGQPAYLPMLLVVLVGATAVSYVTWRLVERPAQRYRNRFDPPRPPAPDVPAAVPATTDIPAARPAPQPAPAEATSS